jgi:DNA polymerase I-like protein with 3'-5' exonuclease and polymerase domains
MFLEIDYNAADLRSLFLIRGRQQPNIDIHDWNIQNIFGKETDRDLAKKMMFGWLYDLNKRDDRLEKVYGRDYLIRKFWNGTEVENPFGRKIKCDEEHAISYLIQSTTADYVGRKLVALYSLLKGKKSYIAFSIHDSIVIDFDWSEKDVILPILEIIRKEGFVATLKAGKDFENLKVINL